MNLIPALRYAGAFHRPAFRPLGVFALLVTVMLAACSAPDRLRVKPAPTVFHLADKTSRADVLTQSAIVLSGYGFTIEYASSRALQSALKTHWRVIEDEVETDRGEERVQYRDRAVIHFTSKGYQGDRLSLVSSRIEFELQMRTEASDRWIPVTPDPRFEEQYLSIVDQIQNRLRRLGYRFN